MLQKKGNMSHRFQQMASKKKYRMGPKIKQLVDLIGDTMDDMMQETVEDESTLLDDDIFASDEDYFDSSETNADEE